MGRDNPSPIELVDENAPWASLSYHDRWGRWHHRTTLLLERSFILGIRSTWQLRAHARVASEHPVATTLADSTGTYCCIGRPDSGRLLAMCLSDLWLLRPK